MKVGLLPFLVSMISSGYAGAYNFVKNGSFELPDYGSGAYVRINPGDAAIADWIVPGSNIGRFQLHNGHPQTWDPGPDPLTAGSPDAGGFQYLSFTSNDLEYHTGQTITQVVTGLTPGESYTLHFDLNCNNYVWASTISYSLQNVTGTIWSTEFPAQPMPGNFKPAHWRTFSVPFIASAAEGELQFTFDDHGPSPGGGGDDWTLDRVAITGPGGPDLVATSLSVTPAMAGVDFFYAVVGADLFSPTTATLYWADGETLADRIFLNGVDTPAYEAPLDDPVGTYGPFYVPFAALGERPATASHLLLVVDPPSLSTPAGLIPETDEENNVAAAAVNRQDLVAVSLTWNHAYDTLEMRYRVDGGALPVASTARLFWARGPGRASILLPTWPLYSQPIRTGTGGPESGEVITLSVCARDLDEPAEGGTTHLVLVLDDEGAIPEASENNNVASWAIECDAVLRDAMSLPEVIRVDGREGIVARLIPGLGLTVGDAAKVCGIDHFNFRNSKLDVPPAWEVRDNDTIVKASYQTGLPASGLLDPLPGGTRRYHDPRNDCTLDVRYPYFADDLNDAYWDDDLVTTPSNLAKRVLEFEDSPYAECEMYQEDERELFFTELVGVDQSGKIVISYVYVPSIRNAGFLWYDNQTTSGGGVYKYDSTVMTEESPAVMRGGVTVVRVVNPRVELSAEYSSSGIRVSWPYIGEEVYLEGAASPAGPWSVSDEEVIVDGGRSSVRISSDTSAMYFRLRIDVRNPANPVRVGG